MLKLFAFRQRFAVSTADAPERREEGQTMAEYGVVLTVITLAVVVSLTLLSASIRGGLENIASLLPG